MPEAYLRSRPSLIRAGSDLPKAERCGIPRSTAYEEVRDFLFLDHLHGRGGEMESRLSSSDNPCMSPFLAPHQIKALTVKSLGLHLTAFSVRRKNHALSTKCLDEPRPPRIRVMRRAGACLYPVLKSRIVNKSLCGTD